MSPSDGVTKPGASGGATSDDHTAPMYSPGRLRVRIDGNDGYTRVTVVGEIDHDTAPLFRAALMRALGCRGDLLAADLGGVDFCDCAGLNVLLRVRACAEDRGVTLALAGVGDALRRLLTVTETLQLFCLVDPVPVPPVNPARSAGPG